MTFVDVCLHNTKRDVILHREIKKKKYSKLKSCPRINKIARISRLVSLDSPVRIQPQSVGPKNELTISLHPVLQRILSV